MRARNAFVFALPIIAALTACSTTRGEGAAAPSASVATIPPTSGDGAGLSDDGKPFDNDVSDIVGHPAKAWKVDTFVNSGPLKLEDLRGKVVLVRWFMGSTCPMCSATAPSLNELHEKYGARGLSVIGMYHHKDDDPLTKELVLGYVKHFGYEFPVAIDDGWRTLKDYWLTGHEYRKYTSVSFLIDKKGIVRNVHLGGRLAPGEPAFKAIKSYVETLLAEAP